MMFSDVKAPPRFHPVALCKFSKHCVVVGGIIAGYMSNLYPEINYSPEQNS